MRPDAILNFAEMRAEARRVLPRGLFDYIDRGAEDETSIRVTRQALDAVRIVPSVLEDVSRRSCTATFMGETRPLPLAIAPTAAAGLVWPDGEVELARAAKAAGVPFCVSTQSMTSVERIAESGAELWFQLYVWYDRALTHALVERAWAAGCRTLVLTADTPIGPKREYNQRNGFAIPLKPSLRAGLDVLAHPGWLRRVLLRALLTEGVPTYAHYPEAFRTPIGRVAMGDRLKLADNVTWDDLAELRRLWAGRLVVKGVLALADAERAADLGADAIVVSNHGARNLDSAPPPIDLLPEIATRCGHRLTILADSGVRRGSDVVKLLAAGAEAVLVGRAPLWGLACGGQAGALRSLDILRDEILDTLALAGLPDIAACRSAPVRRAGRPLDLKEI